MSSTVNRVLCFLTLAATFAASPANAQDNEKAVLAKTMKGAKTVTLFDGKTLDGWRGREDLWSVDDGAIHGQTTDEAPIKQNTFLILDRPVKGSFELTLQFKMIGGNSGIQYRSKVLDEEKFIVGGYQADIDATNRFAGILYEEKGRGILATRGQQTTIWATGEKTTEQFATAEELANSIHLGEWNDYRILVRDNHLEQFINETLMIRLVDQQPGKKADSGVIALQLHQGPAMKVWFKNIQIREWK